MSDPKPEIKLDIRSKSQANKMHKGKEIGGKMKADPNPQVASIGAQLEGSANSMETINTNRNNKRSEAADLTDNLNDEEHEWDTLYKKAAQVAMDEYPGDDGKWKGYGFEMADITPTKRSKPPKVTGLQVTQGDEQGEADLVWDPQNRQLIDGYYLQINTVDPDDLDKWLSAEPISVSASKASITGLTKGQKYWVRVIAFVGKTKGVPSDEKDVIAP